MADKAPITPQVLRWARLTAKFSIEIAATKVKVAAEKLDEWENGISQPTIVQAQSLAKLYKRPFAILFLPNIPTDFQPLQDYRKNADELSTASIFIIREIQERQAWISEFYQENGEAPLPFVGKFSIRDSSDTVAADILKTLEIRSPYYQTSNPVKEWVDKAEAKGVFISRSSFIHSRMKFDSDEIKGFAIADEYAPFIFVNTEDWKAPQLFTLVHELAHIWIGQSGVSNESDLELKLKHQIHQVEAFCNEVAAAALMQNESMNRLNRNVFKSQVELFTTAKNWGVSSFALLVRALHMNLISTQEYNNSKAQADSAYKQYLVREEAKRESQKKDTDGGPSYYQLQLNKVSPHFTRFVLEAYRSGMIPPTQASSLLNVKTNNFPKLEKYLSTQA
ncbi:XRE family transcriptional regulator [Spirosoma linguale]|uniref:HTH cro/C1-type domain-containing protein n=1 Tax=Spirosoma linguale (strain ATCC 33905 / DSM 74 / LMG 10896 / Claus 1) TaxID=504472 RepID=D2QTJ7_SPILD|nr:protein of unknown function DUF955 [Spirosoma linguale DSM 74]